MGVVAQQIIEEEGWRVRREQTGDAMDGGDIAGGDMGTTLAPGLVHNGALHMQMRAPAADLDQILARMGPYEQAHMTMFPEAYFYQQGYGPTAPDLAEEVRQMRMRGENPEGRQANTNNEADISSPRAGISFARELDIDRDPDSKTAVTASSLGQSFEEAASHSANKGHMPNPGRDLSPAAPEIGPVIFLDDLLGTPKPAQVASAPGPKTPQFTAGLEL